MKKIILAVMLFLSLFASVVSAQIRGDTYAYDALNRLTNVSYGNGLILSYTYDANGNITSQKSTIDATKAWNWEWYRATNQLANAEESKKPESAKVATKNGEISRDFLNNFYRMQMTNGVVASHPALSNEFTIRYKQELKKMPAP